MKELVVEIEFNTRSSQNEPVLYLHFPTSAPPLAKPIFDLLSSILFQALVVYECLSEWGQILCAICPNPKLVITGGTSTAICVWETGTSKERAKSLTLKQVKAKKTTHTVLKKPNTRS